MPALLHLILPSLITYGAAALNAPAILQRQQSPPADDDLIDPVLQPYCDFSFCWHWGRPPPELCPLVQSSCANDSFASDNMAVQDGLNGKRPKCGIMQYQRDCYCSLKTSLSCAWNCTWEIWFETEDWFASVCPDAPAAKPIDFSGLPACARDCLDDAVFQSGCLTQTSNCFCSYGDLFGCHEKCEEEGDRRRIAEWLRAVCDITQAKAAEALATGKFSPGQPFLKQGVDGGKVSPLQPAKKQLRWDEVFVVTAVSLAALIGVVTWLYNWCAVRPRRKIRKS